MAKTKKFGTGLLDDNRSTSAKAKDYWFNEVASASPVNWIEKPPSTWRKFPVFNQNGSSACVANATAKVLGIENLLEEQEFVNLSRRDIYTRRLNPTALGMYYYDALAIASNWGSTLEPLMPSENLTEALMNKTSDRKKYTEQIGKVFKASGYVQLPHDIDVIGSIIQSGKGVLLGFRFDLDEWLDVPIIKTTTPSLHHGVAGVDLTLYEGEKSIVIDDSWGKFGQFAGQRVIKETFLKDRITFAGYLLDLSNDWRENPPTKPVHTFTTPMQFGQTSDEIKFLQQVLRYEQLFPQNTEITGYYGAITAKGVLAFQIKYQIDTPQALLLLGGKIVGPKTITKLNELYGS